MLEISFTCPSCSRIFLRDCPFAGPIPAHLDALLGLPCRASGIPLQSYLEFSDHVHDGGWPFGLHRLAAPPG